MLGVLYSCEVRPWLSWLYKGDTWNRYTSEWMSGPEGLNHSSSMNHGKRELMSCVPWSECGNTNLFSKERHDREDNKRHEDTVRPELQFIPIHSPGRKNTSVTLKTAATDAEIMSPVKVTETLEVAQVTQEVLFCSEAMRRKEAVCRGQQGNRVTRWHHPTPCACYFTTSETAEEQRGGSAVWHLASILQLLTDLKQLGLILTSGIFQLNKGSGFHDKTPLKPPRGITAAPTWQHSVSCEDSSKFLI